MTNGKNTARRNSLLPKKSIRKPENRHPIGVSRLTQLAVEYEAQG